MIGVNGIQTELTKRIGIKDLGEAKHYWSPEISCVQPDRKIWLSQSKLPNTVLSCFKTTKGRRYQQSLKTVAYQSMSRLKI